MGICEQNLFIKMDNDRNSPSLPTTHFDAEPSPFGVGEQDHTQLQQEETKNYKLWNFEYWSFLFNVDTTQVGHRLLKSLIPWPPTFFDVIAKNPDLYGPFWIASTLVFILAATGNVARFLTSWTNDKTNEWSYNLDKLSVAAGTLYGYLGVVPLLLFFVFKWQGIKLRWLHLVCIYGYSLFIYIPISVRKLLFLNFYSS